MKVKIFEYGEHFNINLEGETTEEVLMLLRYVRHLKREPQRAWFNDKDGKVVIQGKKKRESKWDSDIIRNEAVK